MDFVKKIPPSWIVVAVLIVIVFVLMFRQSRSGYTPTAGAPITLMDLQEYLVFSPALKQNYVNKLMAYQPRLSNAVSSNSFTTYKMLLDEVMTQAVIGSPMPPVVTQAVIGSPMPSGVTQSKCPRGQYSPTGNQPGCMPCPMNTYCPMEGMTTPLMCPTGMTSPIGSTEMFMCTRMPKCPSGQYSTTGNQPGCMPCPMNTYCPTEGTTTPIRCSQPLFNQYVTAVCTRTSNTQLGPKTVCPAPKQVSGYIQGSFNILGTPGTCI